MKLGWLVWEHDDDDEPKLVTHEPDYCHRKVQIVYAYIED